MNNLLDFLSEFLARRKGLLPLIGILFVILNAILRMVPGTGWIESTDLMLHLGIVIAILGFLLAFAL